MTRVGQKKTTSCGKKVENWRKQKNSLGRLGNEWEYLMKTSPTEYEIPTTEKYVKDYIQRRKEERLKRKMLRELKK